MRVTINKEFRRLVREGIASVARRQDKKEESVCEDIAEKVGCGRDTIERMKRGHSPSLKDIDRVAVLVRHCLAYGRLDRAWTRSVLHQARYPKYDELLETVFRSEDGGYISPDDEPSEPLAEFNTAALKDLETPGGAVKLEDRFYIEREAEMRFQYEVRKSGTTTTIRAPRQTGKTSLLVRGLHQARQAGSRVIDLDLQSVNGDYFTSADRFLHYLARFICDELELNDVDVERLWQGQQLPNQKLTNLLRRHILPQIEGHMVLAIDEADRLLHTDFSEDFFGLLRSWHNNRARDERWNKLNIVLVISTEPHLLIRDISQSPFNVGLRLYMEDFDQAQVQDLNQRHGSPLNAADIASFMTLFNGQPYLTRMALYTLVTEKLTWPDLQDSAALGQGPFGDHLQHHFKLLIKAQPLRETLKEVIRHQRYTDETALFRLLQAGLVKRQGSNYVCRCDLYRIYFDRKL